MKGKPREMKDVDKKVKGHEGRCGKVTGNEGDSTENEADVPTT